MTQKENLVKQAQFIQKQAEVPLEYAGLRLDFVLSEIWPEYSRSQLQKWLRNGEITVDSKIKKAKIKIHGCENIILNAKVVAANDWIAENIDLNVIYEDNDVMVINKHAGIVVHPGAGNTHGTISNALLARDECFYNIPRAGIVHRLDKDTTGLMVVAKTTLAYNSLVEQLSERCVSRRYVAIVDGIVHLSGKVDAPIARSSHDRTKMAVVTGGKEAITFYTPIEHFNNHSLVECKLMTGRTHQIRVHMKSIAHPLLGDPKYNKRPRTNKKMSEELKEILGSFDRQALHAHKLTFEHPQTGEKMKFKARIPKDMQNVRNLLRDDVDQYWY